MGKNIYNFGYNFSELFKFFVKISPGYHTPASQSPRSIIPWRVTHDLGESTPILKLFAQAFKGTVSHKCGIILFY